MAAAGRPILEWWRNQKNMKDMIQSIRSSAGMALCAKCARCVGASPVLHGRKKGSNKSKSMEGGRRRKLITLIVFSWAMCLVRPPLFVNNEWCTTVVATVCFTLSYSRYIFHFRKCEPSCNGKNLPLHCNFVLEHNFLVYVISLHWSIQFPKNKEFQARK